MNEPLIVRRDPDFDHLKGKSVEFRLTYDGELRAHNERRLRGRPCHVHEIRQRFHEQLRELWKYHPILNRLDKSHITEINLEGFRWRPIATNHNGLICKLDILMLRSGDPGKVLTDIDNRLKTLFDALKMPDGPEELGAKSDGGQITPKEGETPFFILLQDDDLITHVSVTTDILLDPVKGAQPENAVRLILNVTIAPYKTTLDNLDYG